MRTIVSRLAALALAAGLAACSSDSASSPGPAVPTPTSVASFAPSSGVAGLQQNINHIVVISQENWSFDGLFGHFPGANGIQSNPLVPQVDSSGNPITALPPATTSPTNTDTRFNPQVGAPVAPFDDNQYVSAGQQGPPFLPDTNHNYYAQIYQIDGAPPNAPVPGAGGKMDRYLALPPSAGTSGLVPLGYYDATNFPEGKIAQAFVLADNLHQSAFGGSFINNLWLFCACTPTYPNAPASIVEPAPDPVTGFPPLANIGGPEGRVTPDGYGVNTMFPANYPQTAKITPPAPNLLPPQNLPTIGDELSAANVSWKWYAGGLANALAGTPDPTYQPHHQAPLFFANYAPGTPGASHVVDETQFFSDLAAGTLPAVSFVKNLGAYNEHPGYTNVLAGQFYTANLINQIMMSKNWPDTLVVVLYDEAGGHYDHMPPNPVDRWGPSTRVPAYIVSPWAKRGFVDHTNYEAVSVLATIEARFGLKPLGTRDAAAATFVNALDFTQPAKLAVRRRPLGITQVPPQPAPPVSKTGKYPVTELDD